MLSPRPVLVSEGKEPSAFWEALGGKSAYHTPLTLPLALPRLFLCTNASGRVDVEPEDMYTQEDLATDLTALLDDAVSAVSYDRCGYLSLNYSLFLLTNADIYLAR
jgi:hypothetical protein